MQQQELETRDAKNFMHVDEFRQFVGNKIFWCRFVKQNGEIREMKARLGVTKYLKGGELGYNASEYNNLIVFDMEKQAYRTVPFDRLLDIKYCKKEWHFE